MKKILLLLLIFSNDLFAQENQIILSAEFVNPNSDSLVIHNNVFKTTIKGKDGKFQGSFNAPQGFYQLFDGAEFATLYLSPGFKLNLKDDGKSKKFRETLSFDGVGATENRFLVRKATYDRETKQSFGSNLPSDEELQNVLKTRLSTAKEILINEQFSKTFAELMIATYEQENQRIAEELRTVRNKANEITSLKGITSPDFNYVNYKGGKTFLSALKGKFLYIDIWATWCAPCRAEIPFLKELELKYKDKPIEFVSISVDVAKDLDKWKQFVSDNELSGTQLLADNAWQSEWIEALKIKAITRFVIIDTNGKVIDPDAMRPSSSQINSYLEKLLKK